MVRGQCRGEWIKAKTLKVHCVITMIVYVFVGIRYTLKYYTALVHTIQSKVSYVLFILWKK